MEKIEKPDQEGIDFVNLEHARDEAQKKLMEQIKKDKVCPFCPEFLKKYHPKPILKMGEWWTITENMAPYEGTNNHLLLVYNKHATKPGEISKEAAFELFILIEELDQQYNINGGAVFMRFGDTNLTGASVDHLHFHLICGNASQTDEKRESLKVTLGYKKL